MGKMEATRKTQGENSLDDKRKRRRKRRKIKKRELGFTEACDIRNS